MKERLVSKSEEKYIRDGRAPTPENESISRLMSANKAKNTTPELLVRKYLWKDGFRGYRLNYKKVVGRPDIAFSKKNIAIFVHGCFWHRCPICDLELPKSNRGFWKEKFRKNRERDKKKIDTLENNGWRTFVIWECQTKEKSPIPKEIMSKITRLYNIDPK